jgi:hypothetical protein
MTKHHDFKTKTHSNDAHPVATAAGQKVAEKVNPK